MLGNSDDKGEDSPFVGFHDDGFIGGMVGFIVWGIGVDDGGKAACDGCGQEVDRKLITCSHCGTPIRYALKTTPEELTPMTSSSWR